MVRMTVVPDRVERADEHGPEPAPEEERGLRKTIQGMKTGSANRPQSAQVVPQSVIESRSELGTECVTENRVILVSFSL